MQNETTPDGCHACGALPCDWVDNPGWRLIETAPRDGTAVIINVDDTVGEAYFSASDDHHEGWWWANTSWGDYWADKAGNPTHWLPLPSAPTVGEGR